MSFPVRSTLLLAACISLVGTVPAAAQGLDPNPSGHEFSFAVGMQPLKTAGGNGVWVYSDPGDDYPFVLSVPSQSSAFSVSGSYAYANAMRFDAVSLEPTFDLAGIFGQSVMALKVQLGVRMKLNLGMLRPWAAAGVGLAAVSTTLATVPYGNNTGADYLIAPDGSTVSAGESVSASAVSLGGYVGAGADLAFGRRWGLRAGLSYSIYGLLNDWTANANNQDGQSTQIGSLGNSFNVNLSGLGVMIGPYFVL